MTSEDNREILRRARQRRTQIIYWNSNLICDESRFSVHPTDTHKESNNLTSCLFTVQPCVVAVYRIETGIGRSALIGIDYAEVKWRWMNIIRRVSNHSSSKPPTFNLAIIDLFNQAWRWLDFVCILFIWRRSLLAADTHCEPLNHLALKYSPTQRTFPFAFLLAYPLVFCVADLFFFLLSTKMFTLNKIALRKLSRQCKLPQSNRLIRLS